MEPTTRAPVAQTPDELRRLAEFVGRLYLLLVTVVFDHPRWLPREQRANYQRALREVYPSVHQLQTALLDPVPSDRVLELIREAGFVGAQLELKLGVYFDAEAHFYGGRVGETIPDRRFRGEDELWRAPALPEDRAPEEIDEVTSGGKRPRFARLLDPVFSAANTILGSLLDVFHVAGAYKEIKEGVEFGVKNNKLIRRIVHGTGSRITRLRDRLKRREREQLRAGEDQGQSRLS
jgi:hypothetical protein